MTSGPAARGPTTPAGVAAPAGVQGRVSPAPALSVPPAQVDQSDLGSRLARFRARQRAAAEPTLGTRPPSAGRDLAERLASTLGGVVERGPLGQAVRVRASVPLPISPRPLAALPFPIEADRPLLCLDTETTGLGTAAGTVVFLVGLGRWDGDRFEVDQLVLPDHPDEPAFLDAVERAIPSDAWLVTYNGQGFDWPLLVTRFRLHGSAPPAHAGHLDLLPVARQLWRHRLGDARLATVERGIVGVRRTGDLPGALVPGRYLEFLRTGHAEPLRAVLDHNRQDVVSLGRLLEYLATRLASPFAYATEPPGDIEALGRAYARRGRLADALACYETALAAATDTRFRTRAAQERARLLRRCGRHRDSAAAWQEIADAGGPPAALAWIQLAKHYEHVAGDPAAALHATEQAARLLERHRLLGSGLPQLERDLARRRPRLLQRVLARDRDRTAGSGAIRRS